MADEKKFFLQHGGVGALGVRSSPTEPVAAGTVTRPHVGHVVELEKGFRLYRPHSPRFAGHGLFHVLSELLPRDAVSHGDLTVHAPAAWQAFCSRWDRHPNLRLLWYAPEDDIDDEVPPVGAARMFYVLEYSHLTPRTWRYALDPSVIQQYAGKRFQSLEPEGAMRGPPQTVGKTFKHYLHAHIVDASVVTHTRGGILMLLNATQECTHGIHALTQSQLPTTLCVVVRRSLLTVALWCVLRQERRVFRLDYAPEQWTWTRFCEPALRWSALRVSADMLDGVEDELLRVPDVPGFHCARLEIFGLRTAHHDLMRVMTVAKLLAWRLLRTAKPRVVVLEGLNNPHASLLPPPTDAAKLRHTELRKLFTELSDAYAALAPPINVLYV
jgi:hypothetical protein